jgi:hypothetical protein
MTPTQKTLLIIALVLVFGLIATVLTAVGVIPSVPRFGPLL